jgi:FdhE protein
VKAETCGACRTYSRLFYLEQAPATEPCADDVATLLVDLLVGRQGYRRQGINLLLPSGTPL